MSPRLILTLWRERWGKSGTLASKVPYVDGRLNQWGRQLAMASTWSLPGASVLISVLCGLFFVLMLSVELSLNSQIAFSVFIACFTLYMRRYTGLLVTLTLLGLSLLASTRYLYWRLSASLGSDFNWDLVFGFGLVIAELHLFLLTTLRFLPALWPLKQAQAPLPDDTFSWPSVDVFIPCHAQSFSAIEAATQAVMAFDWPHAKLHTYLLDDDYREEVKALADATGATYLTHPDNADGSAGAINQALPDAQGQLIAVLDAAHPPGKDFLNHSVGWFVQDEALGMLQTPQHFLAPAPSPLCASLFETPTQGSAALIRRAMLVEIGGVASAPVTPQAHTARTLQAAGYRHAYIGLAPQPTLASASDLAPAPPSAPEVFRVDHPFSEATLRWKLRLHAWLGVLEFYYTVPRYIFFAAPALYLLAGVNLIQAPSTLFLAYALPHLIHHLIAQARMQGGTRFTVWVSVRETTLAWYMWVRTAMTLMRTELSQIIKTFRPGRAEKKTAFNASIRLPYVSVLVLNLAGVFMGSARLPFIPVSTQETTALYLLWSVFNLLTLAGMMAVARETKHIRQHLRAQLRIPALVRLPSGRSVMCQTENFPAKALELKLPVPAPLEAGLRVSLSIFHGRQEFDFPARVLDQRAMILRLAIEDSALKNYRALGMAVHSRGENWPKWLPDRDTDHPLPAWLSKSLTAFYGRTLLLGKHLGKHFVSGIQKWKKKK